MSTKKAEPVGLFDAFLEPFELKQQSIPKAKRAPLRLFLVLELKAGRWAQRDEVLAANLTSAGEVALEARGRRDAVWSFPIKGAAIARTAKGRPLPRSTAPTFAVIDPELAKPADLPTA